MSRQRVIIFTALLLGLAWAVRGHFGHEWGAAWAGAVGGLAVVVGAQRSDWLKQLPYLGALSALGWSVGGMMSYGIVIGYCRGDDFTNVFYGYSMLAVIGGLYGCIGGGLLGLGLESTDDRKPQWASLITEMVAGAMLIWGIVIYQLEWFMTPPRSELWAACLGSALAMLWHLQRHGYHRALRVALITCLGAAMGFSVGNFIQMLGIASGISYNWWNVMEFTLGFCGGASMAYAISTQSWPETTYSGKRTNLLSLLFICLVLPLINFSNAFTTEKINNLATQVSAEDPAHFLWMQKSLGLLSIALIAVLSIWIWKRVQITWHKKSLLLVSISALGYVLLGLIHKGFFHVPLSINNSATTYLPILALALFIGWRTKFTQQNITEHKNIFRRGGIVIFSSLVILIIISLISVYINQPPDDVPRRFMN